MERPGGVAFSSSWRYPGETEQDFPYKISLLREATYKNEHSGSLSWKNRGLNWFWKGVLVEKRGTFPSFSCNSSTDPWRADFFFPFHKTSDQESLFVRKNTWGGKSLAPLRFENELLFRSRHVLRGISCTTRVHDTCSPLLDPHRFEIHGHLRNGFENIKEALIDGTGETTRKFSGRQENKPKGITVHG